MVNIVINHIFYVNYCHIRDLYNLVFLFKAFDILKFMMYNLYDGRVYN